VIGDVSFIHDTNGLNLLRTGGMSPALTVVLINNSGGGIFNFLPIAAEVPDEQFRPLWTTPQYVDIAGMCRAQGIPHMRVTNLAELETSLRSSWALNRHCVLEVVTNIESNVLHHEEIKGAVRRALDGGLAVDSDDNLGGGARSDSHTVITRVRVETDSLPLTKPLTTSCGRPCTTRDVAYILMDAVCSDGTPRRVIGEIAPLPGLHRETLEQAVEQVNILARNPLLQGSGVALSPTPGGKAVPGDGCMAQGAGATGGSDSDAGALFRSFMESLGIPLDSVYPSVACGVEAALYQLQVDGVATATDPPGATLVSALIDPHGKSAEMIAAEAHEIVTEQGYGCIKVKAGRADDPETDAAYLRVIRQAVGGDVALRVDANQSWTAAQAATYVEMVGDLGVEYLEEPLANPTNLFHWDASGVPIALDESIDQGVFDLFDDGTPLPTAVQFVVLKPSLIGGLSKTLALSRQAALRGLRTVISSSFESPLGLVHLSQIASAVEAERPATGARQAHGISTESWFQGHHSGLTSRARGCEGRIMPARVRLEHAEATSLLTGETLEVKMMSFTVRTQLVDWNVTEAISGAVSSASSAQAPPIVLVHGMFGSATEMYQLACALRQRRPGTPVLCVDLPGHGQSKWTQYGLDALRATDGPNMLDLMSEALDALLLDDRIGPCVLVGYSLGARLALSMCLRDASVDASDARRGVSNVIQLLTLSGGLGIGTDNPAARSARVEKDDTIAHAFESLPRREFFDSWYGAPLWDSMRAHPGFAKYVAAKAEQTADPQGVLAATLRDCSPGRVAPLREALDRWMENESPMNIDIVMMVGDQDATYFDMASTLDASKSKYLTLETVRGAGHAVHLEAPDTVASLIAQHVP
jgi:isochorismate synthase/2-succinyl-5-enolpyruvyl-6-hydroxy-3-cyclohexene-1-carboxylate synthase/2-succinyl-6-hydroxy-2,4-cyclohexadiene-1-carboxylate synthase/O-succinylbenzoate synthase